MENLVCGRDVIQSRNSGLVASELRSSQRYSSSSIQCGTKWQLSSTTQALERELSLQEFVSGS